jgi:Glycosyltransferase family 87
MVVAWSDTHHAVMNATQELLEGDFARFWYVGKQMALQRMAEFGFPITPPVWLQSTFHLDILAAGGHPYDAWLYPPTMNLLAMAFAFLPLPLSFFVWGIGTLAAAGWLLRRAGLGWRPILAGLASTASIQDFRAGQNGVLTGGVLVAALLMVETRPWLGGWVAGILCIKPQMALALPVILLRRCRCKVLAACMGSIVALLVLSAVIEGWQSWVWFFKEFVPRADDAVQPEFSRWRYDGIFHGAQFWG